MEMNVLEDEMMQTNGETLSSNSPNNTDDVDRVSTLTAMTSHKVRTESATFKSKKVLLCKRCNTL
ncbi:hypothetical protein DPMN_052478 [Dreissena polymorpha]|uniref:Uncharacterized protein n=1 Tax=Dreissena polymorpha TaxID=45954 RepID=A0A9D4HPV1_DREPO|nr:hypothetical protein DPMN_052478 [Dreissena polymorpha]